MDNRERLELRRRRMAEAPPILRGGFRPFFLGAGIWAVVAIAIRFWSLETGAMRIGALDPLAWHRHEMLFGFVGAAIAGFALTAVPNWTGRLPIAGWPLAALASWWLTARLLPFALPALPLFLLVLVDAGFYIGLALLILREILQAKNRNVPVAAVIGLFGVANALDYLGVAGSVDQGLGISFGIALAVVLVSLIGGRIVPSFTRNWMQREKLSGTMPTQPGKFDIAVIIATAAALLAWIIAGYGKLPSALLAISGLLQFVRLWRWRGWRTTFSPIVIILHVAYAWIPIGLLLLAAVGLGLPIPPSAGIHALTVGAMATMILAVMSRATLGHTGRALEADWPTKACYAAIQLAVLARVCASLVADFHRALLEVAAASWIAAFVLFLIAYGPKLLTPRLD
ncbi:NnrS family protein [Altererythrobacter arenosus]|uniref:NnrS family protein n=1 Tax=Altererythrobacter arenosus TaxID=3032592 RepID=A0ABY8FVF2_9SPHN|nr:NnrS family protein [Altererythrobacter sp. CAU 1644]WFL78968.1 NnrS family protein [Altererythrobacter sp. CAU 1644]